MASKINAKILQNILFIFYICGLILVCVPVCVRICVRKIHLYFYIFIKYIYIDIKSAFGGLDKTIWRKNLTKNYFFDLYFTKIL